MNILFEKSKEKTSGTQLTFNGLGVSYCYVKDIDIASDKVSVLRTLHRHNEYEVHIMISGYAEYEIKGKRLNVDAGELLLIAPNTAHRALGEADNSKKRAVCFALEENSALYPILSGVNSYVKAQASESLMRTLNLLKSEDTCSLSFSAELSELLALECLILILRAAGVKGECTAPEPSLEDARVTLAKQYLKDNVHRSVTLGELASYCYIGTKQLSRIFLKSEGCTIAEYNRVLRIECIKNLLSGRQHSIREISEIMNFSSEYYFNAFFKKHVGVPPGVFRKSFRIK